MEETITYVGLDVHKDTVAIALAEPASGEKCANTATSRTPPLLCGERRPCGHSWCALLKQLSTQGTQPLVSRIVVVACMPVLFDEEGRNLKRAG